MWLCSYYISYAAQCDLQDQTPRAIVKIKMFVPISTWWKLFTDKEVAHPVHK